MTLDETVAEVLSARRKLGPVLAKDAKQPLAEIRKGVRYPSLLAIKIAARIRFSMAVFETSKRLDEVEKKLIDAVKNDQSMHVKRYTTSRAILQDKIAAALKELRKLESETAKPPGRPTVKAGPIVDGATGNE